MHFRSGQFTGASRPVQRAAIASSPGEEGAWGRAGPGGLGQLAGVAPGPAWPPRFLRCLLGHVTSLGFVFLALLWRWWRLLGTPVETVVSDAVSEEPSSLLAHPEASARFISRFYGYKNHSPVLLLEGMIVHFLKS